MKKNYYFCVPLVILIKIYEKYFKIIPSCNIFSLKLIYFEKGKIFLWVTVYNIVSTLTLIFTVNNWTDTLNSQFTIVNLLQLYCIFSCIYGLSCCCICFFFVLLLCNFISICLIWLLFSILLSYSRLSFKYCM